MRKIQKKNFLRKFSFKMVLWGINEFREKFSIFEGGLPWVVWEILNFVGLSSVQTHLCVYCRIAPRKQIAKICRMVNKLVSLVWDKAVGRRGVFWWKILSFSKKCLKFCLRKTQKSNIKKYFVLPTNLHFQNGAISCAGAEKV